MKELHFHSGKLDEAVDLVKRFHYSRRAPGNVQFVGTLHEGGGLFGDYGPALAACFFSIPPTRWSEDVLELSRLVRGNTEVSLTSLISKSCHCLRRNGFDIIVSFADWTQRHHGGVYQAASWNYAGCRDKRMDGVILDGIFYPGRSCNSRWGTQSPSKLSQILGRNVDPHFDEGKHLYWRALTKSGQRKAKRLGLESVPYPKPERLAAE